MPFFKCKSLLAIYKISWSKTEIVHQVELLNSLNGSSEVVARCLNKQNRRSKTFRKFKTRSNMKSNIKKQQNHSVTAKGDSTLVRTLQKTKAARIYQQNDFNWDRKFTFSRTSFCKLHPKRSIANFKWSIRRHHS